MGRVWILCFAAVVRGLRLPSVIIAPAQFGVPKDYEPLRQQLLARGHGKVVVCPLTRLDWLRIAPSALSPAFWQGELRPTPTLDFFYEALDAAFAECAGDEIAVVGHSIGGWVARAYLGERGVSVRACVTLGTPHNPPPASSAVAGIDQTRGLLTYINSNFPAEPSLTCVAGSTVTAASFGELRRLRTWDGGRKRSPLLESLVALPSYAVLAGADPFALSGDGLIPVETALLPGCASIVLDDCHHSGFVPTALDSIILPQSYKWFGSPGIVEQWAGALC